ncbi:MAG: sulfite exporter TauE/SafE family protein [Bryobacterales bacterium]|nr:sulfite exporter TauE/SafE family protein [Bryobacterales bacterium]
MNPVSLILAPILGVGAVVFSMHGQGGGVLYTPIQLLFGIPIHVAAVQSLCFTILTTLSAVLLFHKERHVDWKLSAVLESSSFAGAFGGGYAARLFPPEALAGGLAVLLAASAFAMLFDLHPRASASGGSARLEWVRRQAGQTYRIHLGKGLPLSLLIGITSGLTGVAGGFLKIPMLVRLFGVPIKVAFGSSAFMASLTASGGLLGHVLAKDAVQWQDPLLLGACVLAGAQIGPRIAVHSKPETLRRRFSAYLFAMALLVVGSLWFSLFEVGSRT